MAYRSIARQRRAGWPSLFTVGARLSNEISRRLALRRQRLDLARLDDHALRDIGLTRLEAEAEARRPLWDAPTHWR